MDGNKDNLDLRTVGSDEEIAHWNAVAANMRDKELQRGRRDFLKNIALVASVPLIASGWIAREFKPRIQQEVEFIPLNPDMTIARSVRIEDMTPEAQSDMAITTAWYYVFLRESFSAGMADHAWRIVSLMSDARVQREYQEAHINTNPNSPWAQYAEKRISVSVKRDSYFDLIPPTGYSGPPPGYGFKYVKTVRGQSGIISESLWQSTVQFHRNVPSVSAQERREFNAPGLIVWEYPEPQQLGVSQGIRAR